MYQGRYKTTDVFLEILCSLTFFYVFVICRNVQLMDHCRGHQKMTSLSLPSKYPIILQVSTDFLKACQVLDM